MPLGTSWSDIGRLLWYGLISAGVFFSVALIHWFVIPELPISPAAKDAVNYLLLVPLAVVVHMVWRVALGKAEPSPYRRSKRSAQ